jgi:hypothetical protein
MHVRIGFVLELARQEPAMRPGKLDRLQTLALIKWRFAC